MQYRIEGMTCGGCVARVQAAMDAAPEIRHARIQLEGPQADIVFAGEPPILAQLQTIVHQGGQYTISAVKTAVPSAADLNVSETNVDPPSASTYKPLAIIVGFITGVSVLAQFPLGPGFDFLLWMRHFMAGFFLVFSGFKLLNLRGFADAYRMYDLLAARWPTWGRIYPFVELGLGVMYLLGWQLDLAHILTIVILGFSSIGVIQSVRNKQAIRCACLGDVFNLPMSTVTIVEDLAMVAMAAGMLLA